MLRSRGMWSEHLASGARKGRRVCMGDTLAQFSHNVMEQSAGTAVTPAAMRGSSKAERSDQHWGGGGSTVKRSAEKWVHFLLHYCKGRMTPLLCSSDLHKRADLFSSIMNRGVCWPGPSSPQSRSRHTPLMP